MTKLDHYDDVDLIKVFSSIIEKSLFDIDLQDVPVVQLDQPTQQPRGTSGVFFTNLYDVRIGWKSSDIKYDEVNDCFLFTERQHMEALIQISVLYPFFPDKDNAITKRTAKDIANYLAQKLNSDNSIFIFNSVGIGVLRISDIRQQSFDNDRDQFEFMPSFDLNIVYNRKINQKVPKIKDIVYDIYRV